MTPLEYSTALILCAISIFVCALDGNPTGRFVAAFVLMTVAYIAGTKAG